MRTFKFFSILLIILLLYNFSALAKICYIGDSRTAGMRQAINKEEAIQSFWCCKVGEGYKYLNTTCNQFINNNRDDIDKIIVLFGVNDIDNYIKYTEYLNNLIEANPNIKVYFVSVNPVINEKSKYVKIKDIFAFNYYCKNHLNYKIKYIDTYNNVDFKYTDGIHYTKETYIDIFNYINNYIKEDE